MLQHELFLRWPLLDELLVGVVGLAVGGDQPVHEGLVGGPGEERLLVQQPQEAAAVGGGQVRLGGTDAGLKNQMTSLEAQSKSIHF